ncbi:amino acid transporter, partial [Xanthomonas perforans]
MIVQATVAGFLAGAGLIVAIGAQNAFVLRQGLKRQHVGLVVAICALGDIALILLGVAGIGALAQQYAGLLQL